MAAPLDFYTADMVRALNDAEPHHWPRYETVHGELLVSPGPRMWHQQVAGTLLVALRQYLAREQVGRAFMAPADVSWGLPDVMIQPDIFVLPLEETEGWDWRRVRHLLHAAEVLSPSSTRADRFTKRWLHQEQGTPLYWVVDGDARTVEVWTPDDRVPRVERERVDWYPADATRPFVLALDELFAER